MRALVEHAMRLHWIGLGPETTDNSIPGLVESLFRTSLFGAGGQVQAMIYNVIWVYVLVCFVYGAGSSVLGNMARIPLVAEAADQQVR